MSVKTKRARYARNARKRASAETVGALQAPGSSVTIRVGQDSATIEDPREICLGIAALIEKGEWTEPLEDQAWPHDRWGDPVEFQRAELAANVGDILVRKLLRLEMLRDFSIGYLYRNRSPWEEKGKPVLGKLVKPSGPLRYFSRHDFLVLVNWDLWLAMTPWQKVALVYHELRHADFNDSGKPAVAGHHFEGFFDELELFGTQTYSDWARLAEAAGRGAGVSVQYHLPFEESSARGEDE